MITEVPAIVVGAGVVGLAIARELALAGHPPLVIEREEAIGMITSSRNSEVIHAGIYYPPGSLKARACLDGRERLYAYCAERGVPHRQLGKLIFAAAPEQEAALGAILANARACGVDELQELDATAAAALEPELAIHAALFSPRTGIVDSHALMQALQGEAEAHGAEFAFHTEVARVDRHGDGWALWIAGEPEPVVAAPICVLASGHDAPVLAAGIADMPPALVPQRHFARGCYFAYGGRTPFSHLVYPVPEPGGLGTHLTLDMAGQARFGPDVEWVDGLDYHVAPERKARFVAAAQKIWPALDPERLQPGYAGIRPKISGPGEPAADFRIDGPEAHGLPGLVALYGIESPGLTASLSLATMVREMLV